MKDKLLKIVSEMTDSECKDLLNYTPRRFLKTDKQKNCSHLMRYCMQTGGSTCTHCGWMS